MHEYIAIEKLARILLYCATNGGAKALGLNLGSIEKGKIADFAVFKGFEVANFKPTSTTTNLTKQKRKRTIY